MSRSLNLWIALGLALGLAVGLGAAAGGPDWLGALARASAPFGTLFINAIRMVVIPLVVTLVFASIAGARASGPGGDLGRKARGTATAYVALLLPAITIGMAVTALGLRLAPTTSIPEMEGPVVPELPGMVDFLVGLVPPNPFAAAASGALLPLIVFTLLFGLAAGTLAPERRDRMVSGARDVSDALIKLVHWVLWLAPVGTQPIQTWNFCLCTL
ncbi:MAG: cation:dicarboxylase symporter family transporter [Pseudomonadota bacterium]